MMELQELFLTPFVALVFSFLIAKLVSVAVSAANGEFVESGKKGINEIVKLDRGLKVGGAESKKRVRFSVDEVIEKVEKFRGDLGISLEEKRGKGNLVEEELGRVIGSGGKLGSDDVTGDQSGKVRVLEEFAEGRNENSEMEV